MLLSKSGADGIGRTTTVRPKERDRPKTCANPSNRDTFIEQRTDCEVRGEKAKITDLRPCCLWGSAYNFHS